MILSDLIIFLKKLNLNENRCSGVDRCAESETESHLSEIGKKISLSICMRMTNNFLEISEEIDTETTSHRVVHSSAVRGGAASGPSALE